MKRTSNKKTLLAILLLFAVGAGAVALINTDHIPVWLAPKNRAASTQSPWLGQRS